MHVFVNGVRLFFDVEGTKLIPDGPTMREKPTLLMLHAGPGSDHSIYRPAYSALAISPRSSIAALPPHLVRFERFANCGHAVVPDAPERAMAVIRDFILHPK
jgi:hypothetical protein